MEEERRRMHDFVHQKALSVTVAVAGIGAVAAGVHGNARAEMDEAAAVVPFV